ncbi:MAG: family 10 glycosylhydrolase [Lachnospiraceae bacterium]|nr:family 10 glycosylhydrolase [Lachnospiraceae bacterium]
MFKARYRFLCRIIAFAMVIMIGMPNLTAFEANAADAEPLTAGESLVVSFDASNDAITTAIDLTTEAASEVTSENASESSSDVSADATTEATTEASSDDRVVINTLNNMRGVWVAFPDFQEMGLYNQKKSAFRKNVKKMYKMFKKNKINTVFFHVCPCNDAVYPSKTLKWSSYMCPNYKNPGYDPLKILVKEAHNYGLSFHAWINPYRKTIYSSYNPGKTSSINRVVKIVKEIINNYDVDGIHMDDYFYPSNSYKSLSVKTKKKNVNKMVKKVYKVIKKKSKNLIFGISPAGNIDYAESIGCDLSTWMNKKGYIDYIMPQLYWSDKYYLYGKYYTMYTDRLKAWKKLNKNKKVTMIIGLGLYKAGTYEYNDRGWKGKSNIIVTQIKKEKKAGCKGFVFFSARFMSHKEAKKEMNNYRKYMGID